MDAQPSDDMIRQEREGVILCFVGPPGVGKTALGNPSPDHWEENLSAFRWVECAMKLKFVVTGEPISVPCPAGFSQAIRRAETHNPVFMLDEIDKLGFDFHGDPASALLEVLDPEQNSEFRDHYLEVAYDLSQVMFITTANQH